MSTIEQRIEKLEHRLHLYQGIILVLLLGGVFFLITSFDNKVTDVVQAKEFRVVDDNGKVLVSIGKYNSAGNIEIFSGDGVSLINMIKSDAGTGVVATKTKAGKLACRMGNFDNGDGLVQAYNSDAISVAELGSTDRGTGYLSIKNNNGNDLFKVTYTTGNYSGWVGLYNNDNKNIIRFSGSNLGDANIDVYNHSGYEVCILGADNNSKGALNIYDSYGQNMNGVWPK